jgi:hypothetical protein
LGFTSPEVPIILVGRCPRVRTSSPSRKEAFMKKQVIGGAIILGLGVVTLALGQLEAGPSTLRPASADTPAPQSPDKSLADRSELHARVARLRAEVEVLQLEHDLAKQRLAGGLQERADGDGKPSQRVARDYMRIGAEVVGKGPEFEAAMQEKGDEIWKAVMKAAGTPSPAEVDRLKQDFLRVTTELNRKKIDLVGLEVRLEGSM